MVTVFINTFRAEGNKLHAKVNKEYDRVVQEISAQLQSDTPFISVGGLFVNREEIESIEVKK